MKEDDRYYYGQIDGGEAEGVECPFCGLLYVVFATDDPKKHPLKPIVPTEKVDNYCPCCGKNLKDKITENLKAG